MPWWAIAYLLLHGALAVGGAYDDVRSRKSLSSVAAGILTSCIAVTLAVAFWQDAIAEALGRMALPLFAFAMIWEAVAAIRDLRELEASADPELSEPENRWLNRVGAWTLVLFISPAYVLGGIVCFRVFH